MSNIVNKIKDKVSSNSDNSQKNTDSEPTFSIQPHPNPGQEQIGQGLSGNPAAAHHAKGPHIPSQEVRENLEKPLGREELHARQEELNRK